MRHLFAAAALAAVLLAPAAKAADTTGSLPGATLGSSTRLPVPRFVSLKLERVNARVGPTREHEVAWIYQRAGLPVEVTAEFENWRRIRDHEGTESWVFHSMLSGKRTGMVQPRAASGETVPLLDKPGGTRVVARLQPRVQGQVRSCNRTWCRFIGEGFDGWIEQDRLWGVYPNETVD